MYVVSSTISEGAPLILPELISKLIPAGKAGDIPQDSMCPPSLVNSIYAIVVSLVSTCEIVFGLIDGTVITASNSIVSLQEYSSSSA